MITVKEAGFRYNESEQEAGGFRNISFSLQRGEILSILGPNGCGKTTLLKCLNNLRVPDRGSVSINGKNISGMSRDQIARRVGYMPQSHRPVFPLSVLDVILTGRAPHLGSFSSPGKKDIAIAREALEALGLSGLSDRPYNHLSEGERQLVFLARVLAQKPLALFLDEPVSHLDFGNQTRFLKLVGCLAESGMAIVITSHFPDHSFLLPGKVALMNKGVFVKIGSPEDVITEDNMREVYGINVKILEVEAGAMRKICVPVFDANAADDSSMLGSRKTYRETMKYLSMNGMKNKSLKLN